jgi:hypothetical protein
MNSNCTSLAADLLEHREYITSTNVLLTTCVCTLYVGLPCAVLLFYILKFSIKRWHPVCTTKAAIVEQQKVEEEK